VSSRLRQNFERYGAICNGKRGTGKSNETASIEVQIYPIIGSMCNLEDVQLAAGHADPSTTKLYDRRGYNPEKSASFFANY
jgi:hypothetical protein